LGDASFFYAAALSLLSKRLKPPKNIENAFLFLQNYYHTQVFPSLAPLSGFLLVSPHSHSVKQDLAACSSLQPLLVV
jgi:hypothetical protein